MTTTVDIVRRTLGELTERQRKLEPLIDEVALLKRAIRDVNALLLRLEGSHDGSKSGQRGRPWVPAANTQAAEILKLVRSHERGLHAVVVARQLEIKPSNAEGLLCRLLKAGYVERPAPGFYKITAAAPTEAELYRASTGQ